jgi:hypothetical protein
LEIKHELQKGKIVHKIIHLAKGDKKYGEKEFLKSDIKIENLPLFIWIDSFLSLAGSILYEREDNRKPNDIDIIVRAQEKDGKFWIVLDPALRLKIDRILEKRFGNKSVEWVASTYGPNWSYLPIYDLALIPRKSQKVIEINEPKFAEEFYKEGRHSREKCMECDKPPEYEVLWAEGMAHAWFCKEHFKEWAGQENKKHTGGFTDIDSVKEVKDGVAAKKFGDNPNPNIRDELKKEFEKLHLEEFKQTGIDEDMKNPVVRHKELFAGLRYLGDSGFPRIKEGKEWGEWKLEDILKYYAGITDCLRSVFYPIIPPKIGEAEYKTSYWECYRESRKYMRSKPPATEEEVKEWDKKRKEIIKEKQAIAKFKFLKVDKKEFIVGGIVYPAKEEDSEGDWANKEEIWKALKNFMIKKRMIKVMHKGVFRNLPIIECFQPEVDTFKGGLDEIHKVKAGDWWISLFLGDEREIWERVEKGELTGFSIAGHAGSG